MPQKLSEDQQHALLRDYRLGVSIPDIVQKYGVTEGYPHRLAKRRGFTVRTKRGGNTTPRK